MKVISTIRSPNFSDLEIPVEFVVIHYTAASLERSLELLTSPQTEVSSHVLIGRDGVVYELVDCLGGGAKRAWHAGRSRLECSLGGASRLREGFNDFSLGIELENLNGNIFRYTEAQYASLFALIDSLKGMYPALKHPESIIGHEHIAGFRGKADPGLYFEWERLFAVCYPNQGVPRRQSLCGERLASSLRDFVQGMGISEVDGVVSVPEGIPRTFFSMLSSLLEASISER